MTRAPNGGLANRRLQPLGHISDGLSPRETSGTSQIPPRADRAETANKGGSRVTDSGTGAPFRLLDLFSGIGGFSLGLERSGGFKTVAFCEINPFCRRVLAKHWPETLCYEDVRSLTAERLAADGIAVDAICGGFPCQDISESNVKGAGLDGERSGLWFEFGRLIGELRPHVAIVENTANLLGRGFDRVLGTLATLGYDAEWHGIPASAVGAPHDRDRQWIIAYPSPGSGRQILRQSDISRAHSLFAERKESAGRSSLVFAPPPWQTSWPEVADALCRMDDGLSDGMDSHDGYANAVVPQIPELIGRAILAALHAGPAP